MKCPGCGMKRMCMHILHRDFSAAYLDNQAIFLTLPILMYLIGYHALIYVGAISGERLKRLNTVLGWMLVAIYVLFGAARILGYI